MLVVRGREVVDVAGPAAAELFEGHAEVLVDVGTGDGRFAYALAKADPARLVIGLDSVKENLEEVSRRARQKPAKGGVPNVAFVWARAEDPPAELQGRATAIQVILPWGRLMAGMAAGLGDVLGGLRRLGSAGVPVRAVLNAEIWGDPVPLEVRDIPEVTPAYVEEMLTPCYEACGIGIQRAWLLDREEVKAVRSTWSKKLQHGRDLPRFVGIDATLL